MKFPLFMCVFRVEYIKNVLSGDIKVVNWNPKITLSSDCLSYTVSLDDLYKTLLDSEVGDLLSGGLPILQNDTKFIESKKSQLGKNYVKCWKQKSCYLEGIGIVEKVGLFDVPEGFFINSNVYLLSTLENEIHFRFVEVPDTFKRSDTKIKTVVKGDLIYVTEILQQEDLGVCTL